jgi:UPF0176 protein
MSDTIIVAAFYKFVHLPDYKEMQKPLRAFCDDHNIKGSILLAEEGINGTIAGTRPDMNAVLSYMKQDARLSDLQPKESYTQDMPFRKMKVRLKREIVTIGVDVDPNAEVGTYVDPSEWNDLISDPDVILIDTRNGYEYDVGTFKGAIDPATESFGDFPEYVQQQLAEHKDKKIAMFCTGGIRCEKATSYLKGQGFDQVFHLKGGILSYLEKVPKETSLWQGDCFVFDERITVDHDLKPGDVQFCRHCNRVVPSQIDACPECHRSLSQEAR